MKKSDEEIQHRLEQGSLPGESTDGQAYQIVFGALQREPAFILPTDFADRVLRASAVRKKAKEALHDRLGFAAGLLLLIGGACVATWLTGFKFSAGAFRFVSGYPGLLVFGLLFVLLLHLVDKRLQRHGVFEEK